MTAPISNKPHPGKEAEKPHKKRKKIQDEIIGGAPSAPVPTPPVTSPPPANQSLQDLASKYVAQYEQFSSRVLSDNDRKAMVTDVYNFYSQSSRAGRLASVIIA